VSVFGVTGAKTFGPCKLVANATKNFVSQMKLGQITSSQ
jgi:hypothetical protein